MAGCRPSTWRAPDARPLGRGEGHAPRDVRAGRPAGALPSGGVLGRQDLAPNVVPVIDAGEDGGDPLHRLRVRRGGEPEAAASRGTGPSTRRRRSPTRSRWARGLSVAHAQHGPPRHQAPERPDRRRGAGEADRLRHLPPARAGRDDRHRTGAGHDRLRRTRAGDGPQGRPPLRRLLARRGPLRDAGRAGPLPGRQSGRRGDEARQRGAARRAAAPARASRRPWHSWSSAPPPRTRGIATSTSAR